MAEPLSLLFYLFILHERLGDEPIRGFSVLRHFYLLYGCFVWDNGGKEHRSGGVADPRRTGSPLRRVTCELEGEPQECWSCGLCGGRRVQYGGHPSVSLLPSVHARVPTHEATD